MAAAIAIVNRLIEYTNAFILGGALVYANSYDVTLTKISPIAPNENMGTWSQRESGEGASQSFEVA